MFHNIFNFSCYPFVNHDSHFFSGVHVRLNLSFSIDSVILKHVFETLFKVISCELTLICPIIALSLTVGNWIVSMRCDSLYITACLLFFIIPFSVQWMLLVPSKQSALSANTNEFSSFYVKNFECDFFCYCLSEQKNADSNSR